MINKIAILLWLKHLSYALLLSLRIDYLHGRYMAILSFILFTGALWVLFSYLPKIVSIKGIVYVENETVILKSLLFSLFVLIYGLLVEWLSHSCIDANYSLPIWVTLWCYFTFSRIYRGNWAIFRTKTYSDTYRVLKKMFAHKNSAREN